MIYFRRPTNPSTTNNNGETVNAQRVSSIQPVITLRLNNMLEYTFLVIFGYRAIADLTCDNIGSQFPYGHHHCLGERGLVGGNVVHSCFQ